MSTIDGSPYRVMGREPEAVAAMPQTNLTVFPTQTVYTFATAGVELTLTFLTRRFPTIWTSCRAP